MAEKSIMKLLFANDIALVVDNLTATQSKYTEHRKN